MNPLAAEWQELDQQAPSLVEILNSASVFLEHYLTFPKPAHSTAVALWAAHTWAISAFDFSPYLHISSPVKRCGKSRVFDCLRLLCPKPWLIVNVTEAVIFRRIEQDCPTLLLDEVDTIFKWNGSDENKEGLRALLNAGFERKATVWRCVGPNHELAEFKVFCPKAFAGIGNLPETVADRSIPIVMARQHKGQKCEKFRIREAEPIGRPIVDALEAWSTDPSTIQTLRAARPFLPPELDDRAADICEPLLAIAEMAGGIWPATARSALIELCSKGTSEESIGVQLLGAIREIFAQRGVDRISTGDLLQALIERENGEPWAGWWSRDIESQNTRGPAAKIARILKPFGIISMNIRDDQGSVSKGYKLESFEDAFSRYTP